MPARIIIGVMGPGENATPEENEMAYALGAAIAKQGWVVLTGGRSFGVMDAAMKGASDHNGLTIGVLPREDTKGASMHAQIKIITGIGSARNNINILTSHVVVVLGMAAGTASEVGLALKANKKTIFLNQDELTIEFFKKLGTYKVVTTSTVKDTIDHISDFISMGQIR
ncbi:MAG TPA: TIGR00725 family protein [Cyclobacteriaceae bacterium]|nr:TIGR00725 family protein [Cyclobacteriaceae bacterium]